LAHAEVQDCPYRERAGRRGPRLRLVSPDLRDSPERIRRS